MDYEIRMDSAGAMWKHSINRKGRVLEAGFRVTQATADELLASGEARLQAAPRATVSPFRDLAARKQRAADRFLDYAEDVRSRADAGEDVQVRDWDHAMNRDD